MTEKEMAEWGFWITVTGTLLGIISLLFTIYISNNTRKIRNGFMKKHLQSKYLKSKRTLILQLTTSYELLMETDKIDEKKINETIISLMIYSDILSSLTKKKVKELKKLIENENDNKDRKKQISALLYEIKERLDNELDEISQHLQEAIK
ncbi:hypothetical protein [Bacillus cereus]|uniref:hypothetical protein n=1 Tax=Bacillus cereus TaxID=1396 RepID=UPI001F1CC132|nr:hypothetical protein [Bacillus cereus]MDZ4468095.1 hypothetical protein [Bacillus cereus]MDZ4527834.1 hypothetical protein [Bacillus cereus]